MRVVIRNALIVTLALHATSCAILAPKVPAGQACATPAVSVTDAFAGARRGVCTIRASDRLLLDIVPEDDGPINDSPWYAFRVHPARAGSVELTLRYTGGHHRYWPKYSYDQKNWTRLAPRDVSVSNNRRRAILRLQLDTRPVYVAAQELVLPTFYDTWLGAMARHNDVERKALGRSRGGQQIDYLEVNPAATDVLMITGRQHPPEVSGGFGFVAFAETLLADTPLARQFRASFRIVAIPLLNPDGVDAGHWRHNLGGVDLNRDWGPFTQPETQGVRDLLARLDAGGHKIRVFLDMHSTKRNVFYTQNEEFVTEPPDFMRRWLDSAAARIDNYAFMNDARPVSDQPNSKNYMYKRYGIPTATYEVGDETDRRATQAAARVFANTLMRQMLDEFHSQVARQ